jgi:hypothetical protein
LANEQDLGSGSANALRRQRAGATSRVRRTVRPQNKQLRGYTLNAAEDLYKRIPDYSLCRQPQFFRVNGIQQSVKLTLGRVTRTVRIPVLPGPAWQRLQRLLHTMHHGLVDHVHDMQASLVPACDTHGLSERIPREGGEVDSDNDVPQAIH